MTSSRPHGLSITARDLAIIDSTRQLGTTTSTVLYNLHGGRAFTHFSTRLRQLTQARRLERTFHINVSGALHLYRIGPTSLVPGQPRPWSPSLAQLEHTLMIGQTLVALLDPHLADDVRMTSWHGEADLRDWESPGHPRPDLRVRWEAPAVNVGAGVSGWLDVEVDRGTEGSGAWRRKLARYLTYEADALILVVTTTDVRARRIAGLAHAVGAHLLAVDAASLAAGGDPAVYEADARRRVPLSAAVRTRDAVP